MKRTIKVTALSVVAIGAILIMPMLIRSEDGQLFCLQNVAQAQENVCLPQEATLSAVSFQATLDVTNYRATITALESIIAANDSGSQTVQQMPEVNEEQIPDANTAFRESFATNQNGWNLQADDRGSARLSQGALVLTANPDKAKVVQVPNVSVSDDFYIQVQITATSSRTGAWIAVLSRESGFYHAFGGGGERLYVNDNGEYIIDTTYDDLTEANVPYTLAVESLGGLYTVYIDDVPLETLQITPYGTDIELGVAAGTARFDNLIISANK